MRDLLRNALLGLALVLVPGIVSAQVGTVQGRVIESGTNIPVPGVNVMLEGTSLGTATDVQGNYSFTAPAGSYTLVVSAIGYRRQTQPITVTANSTTTANITVEQDILGLDDIVVTGVAAGTELRKVPFTVSRVSAAQLEEVPALNAASALSGKVAGVRVTGFGQPGSAPAVRLRGSTSLTGSQAPLYIVDGVILNGTLADINSEDIESIEVVKGAAAASLYGSRAANGVVQITTKRGKNLAMDQTRVKVRTELGSSSLARRVGLAEAHPYVIDSEGFYLDNQGRRIDKQGYVLDASGNRIVNQAVVATDPEPFVRGTRVLEADQVADNPYRDALDPQSEVFRPGTFLTNYFSVERNSGSSNFLVSFENQNNQGIIYGTKGYSRQSVRLNLDQRIVPTLLLQTSIAYSQTDQEPVTQGPGSPFFNVLRMEPDSDIYGTNPDGSPFRYRANPYSTEENPFYALEVEDRRQNRYRLLGDARFNFRPLDWLGLEGSYSIDRGQARAHTFFPIGMYTSLTWGRSTGSVAKSESFFTAQTASGTLALDRTFGPVATTARFKYEYDQRDAEAFNATGNNLTVNGVPQLGVSSSAEGSRAIGSSNSSIRSENIYGIVDLDILDRYILSGLVRRDGSSLFGADNRFATYYRLSGKYRISQDFTIPGFQEVAVRASYGTAGLQPGFSAQYETFALSGGLPVPQTLGNRDLKPAQSAEFEVGADFEFLNRFSLSTSYADKRTKDQLVLVPLSVAAGGYSSQWRNSGELAANTFEFNLGAILAERRDLTWSANIVFDRTRQETVSLGTLPPGLYGPGEQQAQIFWLEGGRPFGIMYGGRWMRDLGDLTHYLANNPAAAGLTQADFTVNEEGFVVRANAINTVNERPILYEDETGNRIFQIGNTNPDFNMGFSTTLNWKGLSFYTLLDWQKGGQIYNQTRQWIFLENRDEVFDQSGKPEGQQKSIPYYFTFYNANTATDYFVEDASFLKLREVALGYRVSREQLSSLGLGTIGINGLRLSLLGRNLLTFTDYKGYDPEVAGLSGDATNFKFDGFAYPNFRTYTASLELQF